ncbi:MAG: hypothetical protein KJ941_01605, partial [Bacteroidetes bacterium]|nr:hypothetical protein [Bacteroidota bacterium]
YLNIQKWGMVEQKKVKQTCFTNFFITLPISATNSPTPTADDNPIYPSCTIYGFPLVLKKTRIWLNN